MKNTAILDKLRSKLIVSCQALPHEPLYNPDYSIMGYMAKAAMLGGASGIRANTVRDILAIREQVDLPIIGIIKSVTEGCDVFITPTMNEIDALAAIHCDIIAFDATDRKRPDGKTLDELFHEATSKYPDQLFMADCANYDEIMYASELGFDVVSTTLCGYTASTKGTKIPNFELIKQVSRDCDTYLITEGGIWTPEQLREAFKCGADSAVIGTAITRPMEITMRFTDVISK